VDHRLRQRRRRDDTETLVRPRSLGPLAPADKLRNPLCPVAISRSGLSPPWTCIRRTLTPNHVWCWDFVFDRTANGSPLKWPLIVDEYTRECLTLKIDRSLKAEDVIDTLAELFAIRGVPQAIRSDNGPEFVAAAIRQWLDQVSVQMLYIAPGSPWENGYAEGLHSCPGAVR